MKKTTSIISTIIITAITTCLMYAFVPMAYASNTQLTAGSMTTYIDGKESSTSVTPKPATIKTVKLTYAGKNAVKVSWNKPNLNGCAFNGYVVFYSYNKNMKNAKYDMTQCYPAMKNNPNKTSLTLKNLKKGKKLYVQVRVNGLYKVSHGLNNTNGDLSAVKTFTVGKKTTAKATPKPKAVSSVKLTSKKAGKATLSWKASRVKGLKKQTYTVRYAYNKSMKNAKTKTVKAKSLNLSKLKQGKKLYVQVRTNAQYGKKILHSKWSTKKVATVKKAKSSGGKAPANPYIPVVQLTSYTKLSHKDADKHPDWVQLWWDVDREWTYGGYVIRYAYNKSMKNAKELTVTRAEYWNGNKAMLLKNLKKGKTLYVQVKQYGAYHSTGWSEKATVKLPSKWVKEQGHWENTYKTIVDQEAYTTYTHVYHTHDGWSGTDRNEARQHQLSAGGNIWWEDIEEYHPAVTHQEQTGQRWVVDEEGHWE